MPTNHPTWPTVQRLTECFEKSWPTALFSCPLNIITSPIDQTPGRLFKIPGRAFRLLPASNTGADI